MRPRTPNTPDTFPHLHINQNVFVFYRNKPIFESIPKPFPKQWTIENSRTFIVEDYGWLSEGNGVPPITAGTLGHMEEDTAGLFNGQDELASELEERRGVFSRDMFTLDIRVPLANSTLAASFAGFFTRRPGSIPNLKLICEDYDPQALRDLARSVVGYTNHLRLRHPINSNLHVSIGSVLDTVDWGAFRGLSSLNIDVTHPCDLRPPFVHCEPRSIFSGPSLNLEDFTISFHWARESPRRVDEVVEPHVLAVPDFNLVAESMLAIGGPLCRYNLVTSARGALGPRAAQHISAEQTRILRKLIGKLLCRETEEKGWRQLEVEEKMDVA